MVTVSVAMVAVVIATLSVVLWRAVSSAMTAAAYESAVGTAASISGGPKLSQWAMRPWVSASCGYHSGA